MNMHDRRAQELLRAELTGTIGLLADAEDFRHMRRYATFPFDDHPAYLHHVQRLLRGRGDAGRHTGVALFDPEGFDTWCRVEGTEPDSTHARAGYTAEIAVRGTVLPYTGQPLSDLVEDLLATELRLATREYTAAFLSELPACPACGQDIGRLAVDRAAQLLTHVLGLLEAGAQHLVASAVTGAGTLVAAFHTDTTDTTDPAGVAVPGPGPSGSDPSGAGPSGPGRAVELAEVLAVALATGGPGGLVVRTSRPGQPDRVCGWRIRHGDLVPLTAAEVFDAYCVDHETGDLIAPEPGVDYCAPPSGGPPPPPAGRCT